MWIFVKMWDRMGYLDFTEEDQDQALGCLSTCRVKQWRDQQRKPCTF